jgi:uncharacterized BrkB/YihY/UPF0761 family membrane protein
VHFISRSIDSVKKFGSFLVQKYPLIRFIVNVQKQFNEDEGGNKVGYITYYMFLSLLPLLIASLTIFDMIFARNEALKKRVVQSTLSTIPVIGPTLQSNLSFVKGRGITLVVTLLLLIWAGRGGALALQNAVGEILNRKKVSRSFVSTQWRAYVALVVVNVGVIIATVAQSWSKDHLIIYLVVLIASLAFNSGIIYLVFTIITDSRTAKGKGVIVGGVGITIVQFLSVLIMSHTLQNARPLYGTLAIALAFLAWIALQVRIVLYAAEVNVIEDKSG